MILDNINLNLLRVFEAVGRTGSMTKAASEVFLTQSGVSQNIKNLEEILGIGLFDRVKGRPILTPKGHELYKVCRGYLEQLEQTLGQLIEEDVTLKGEVYLGVPIEYGNTFIMPLVASFSQLHPKVSFRFFYGHASQVNHMLLKGELDFAIVDSYAMDAQIETQEVGYEIHTLCGSVDYLKNFGTPSATKEFLSRLDYIAYLEGAPVLHEWFKHYIKKTCYEGRVKATLMDVQGVAQLIVNGLGVGILPRHLVKKLNQNSKKIYSFKPQGEPLLNRLSLAHLKGRTLSYQAQALEVHIQENLKSYAGLSESM